MKRKSSKYLKFYEKFIKTGMMPHAGLCNCFGYAYGKDYNPDLEIFRPPLLEGYGYWAYGAYSDDYRDFDYSFSPLRQTIVLFMHEMTVNPIES